MAAIGPTEQPHSTKTIWRLQLQHYCESIPKDNQEKLNKELDFERHDGVQVHLGQIADSMDEWEGRVAEELRLTKAEIAAITKKYPDQLNLQTRAALDKWKEKFGFEATYLNLMKAFLKAKKTSFAEAVCKVFTPSDTNGHSTTRRMLSDSSSVSDHTNGRSTTRRMLSDSSSVSDQQSFGEASLASLKLSSFGESSIEDDSELYSDEKVKSGISDFQRRFKDLVVDTAIYLNGLHKHARKEASDFVGNFVTTIRFGLLQPYEGQYVHYMKENAKRLKQFDDMDDVIDELNKVWTFFDYHLIEYIIGKFGSDKLKEKMKTFTDELKVFRCNTTVSQFAKCWSELNQKKVYPQNYKEIDLKVDVDPNRWTLEDLENARAKMCTRLDTEMYPHPYPSTFAILVSEVKKGCVVIVLAVPTIFLSAIIRCELKKSLLAEPVVLNVKVDGIVVDNKMLLEVCSQGKTELVRALMESGVNPNLEVTEDNNSTALHLASCNGNREIVELLLKSNAKIEAKKTNDATPLLMASYDGHTDVVELLLSKGAKPNAQTNEGQTALLYASNQGHLDIAKLLLKHGAKINQRNKYKVTPLVFASENGHTDLVSFLLENGADVKLRNVHNASALSFACQRGHADIVRLLLQHKAPTEERNDPGATPLIVGSAVGQTAVVEVMLDHKANINASTSKTELTVLMLATLNDHVDVVKLLLRRGANVNAQSKDGFTALMIATKNENEMIVEALLFENANPNLSEKETGWTAIFFAVKSGNIGIMDTLIKCGANVNHKDKNGITAMDVSSQAPNPEDVQQFLAGHSGVQVKELNKRNTDKVHKASKKVEDLFISFAKIWAPGLEKRLLAERERKMRSHTESSQQIQTSAVY